MKLDITLTVKPDGSLLLSAIKNNQYIHHTYYGYSQREAKKRFRKRLAKVDLLTRITKLLNVSDDEEKTGFILSVLDFHAYEPMAAAERLSKEFNFSYKKIFNLL